MDALTLGGGGGGGLVECALRELVVEGHGLVEPAATPGMQVVARSGGDKRAAVRTARE
jgi:hypothetical protein